MSNNARRNEKRKAREAQMMRDEEARLIEESRRARLTMWARIEESDASESVKEILHMLAEQCGMEG